MAGEIKTQFKLSGESELNKALKEAYSNLRVLKSEYKATTTGMDRNSTAAQKNAAKADNLKRKIAEQQKVVDTLRKAVDQATKQYEGNTEVINKWKDKLNNAEAALNSMNNQLAGMNDTVSKSTTMITDSAQQTANFATGLGKIKDVAGGMSDAIGTAFSATLDTIKGAVDEIYSLMTNAMALVQNWKGISDIFGGSDESIQRLWLGMKGSGLDTGSIYTSISKLVKLTHNGSNKSMLEQLGLSEDGSENHWDYYLSVLEKIASLQDPLEQQKAAQGIFGAGGWQDIQALMTHWDEIQEFQATIDESNGYIKQAEIDVVDEASVKLNQLQTLAEQVSTMLGTKLIVTLNFGGIVGDAQNILGDVLSLLNAETDEERTLATVQLSADIEILATDIKTAIDNLNEFVTTIQTTLQSSDDPFLKGIGDLIARFQQVFTKILSALERWWPVIEPHLDTIIDLWAANKVSKDFTGKTGFEWLETGIQGIFDWKILKSLTKGSGSNVAADVAKQVSKDTALSGIFAKLGGALLSAPAWIGGLAMSLVPSETGGTSRIGSDGKKYYEDEFTPEELIAMETGQPVQSVKAMQTAIRAGLGWLNADHSGMPNAVDAYKQYWDGSMAYMRGQTVDIEYLDKLDELFGDSLAWRDLDRGKELPVNQSNKNVQITITLDGNTIGHAVAPVVSQDIAYLVR